MYKFLAVTAAVLVLGASVPIAAHVAGSGGPLVSGPAEVDPAVDGQLLEGDGVARVFVHGTTIGAAVAATEAAGLGLVDTFDRVGVAVAVGARAEIEAVAEQPGVTYVQADEPIELLLDTSHRATRGEEARDMTFADPDGGAGGPAPHAQPGERSGGRANPPPFAAPGGQVGPFDGSGVTIAVIDSGVDGSHPMFVDPETGESKVVRNLKLACPTGVVLIDVLQEACLPTSAGGPTDVPRAMWLDLTDAGNDTDTPSTGGHGTHVASIAAGHERDSSPLGAGGASRQFIGAAPGATLVSLSVGQVISVYGGSAGLNWVLENHEAPCGEGVDPEVCPPIRVVNNSWGSGGTFNPNDLRVKLQHQLVEAGIVVVWAAGNAGGDGSSSTTNPPGQSPVGGVISVANYNDGNTGNRDNVLAGGSSRGRQGSPLTYPDISAPGTQITAACRAYLAVCASFESDPDYGTIGGTSMAAPHISGIVALLLQARPDVTPAEVEHALEVTAHKFTAGGPYEPDPTNPDSLTSFDKGHGLVDVVAALGHVLGVPAPAAPAVCTPDGPVVVGATGDATGLAVVDGLPSEPQLDIVEGRLDWDASAETLTFTIEVLDLQDTAPAGTTGIAFDFFFTHAGASYYILASRGETASPRERFVLGHIVTTRQTLVDDLAGEFDPAANTITAVVPNDRLGDVGDGVEIKPFEAGDVLGGFEVVSRRQFGAGHGGFIPDADSAGGLCPYTIGFGAVPPPADDSGGPGGDDPGAPDDPACDPADTPSDVDGAIGPCADSDTVEWTGNTVAPTSGVLICGRGTSNVCTDHFDVFVTAGGDVTFTVTGAPGDDWDIYVFDENRNRVATAATDGDEEITVFLSAGRYEVNLVPFLVSSGQGYQASASWAA